MHKGIVLPKVTFRVRVGDEEVDGIEGCSNWGRMD